MDQINRMLAEDYATEWNLHPIMSWLYSPFPNRPKFDDQRDANTNLPIRSPWRKTEPTEADKAEFRKANTNQDRTPQEVRGETLAADKYDVVRHIPFLPNVIPLSEQSWLLATYTALGATPDDLAHRVATNDADLNERLVCHKQLRNRLKKKIDDWLRLNYGGFQWLGDRQQTRARKGGSEPKHEFASAVLTGYENSSTKRQPVSEWGYYFVRQSPQSL
jgi:hypothetical protein